MSLTHDFYLSNSLIPDKIYNNYNVVKIPDDFFITMQDYLLWVTSKNEEGRISKGLDYYGSSIIEGENLKKLLSIIVALQTLYECANDSLELTGLYLLDNNTYEKNSFKKKDILNYLELLHNLVNEAINLETQVIYRGI